MLIPRGTLRRKHKAVVKDLVTHGALNGLEDLEPSTRSKTKRQEAKLICEAVELIFVNYESEDESHPDSGSVPEAVSARAPLILDHEYGEALVKELERRRQVCSDSV